MNQEEVEALQKYIEVKSRVDVLEDRFDRHLDETRTDIKVLNSNVQGMRETISNLKIDLIQAISETKEKQSENDRDLNVKLYTVNGLIALIVSFLTALVTAIFKK